MIRLILVVALAAGCSEKIDWQAKYDKHASAALQFESEVATLIGAMTTGAEGEAVKRRINELDIKIAEEVRLAADAKAHGARPPDRQTEIVMLKSKIASTDRVDQELKESRDSLKQISQSSTNPTSTEGKLNEMMRKFDGTVSMHDIALQSLENQMESTRLTRKLKLLRSLE